MKIVLCRFYIMFFLTLNTQVRSGYKNVFSKMSDEPQVVSFSQEIAQVLTCGANWEEHLTPAPICIAYLGE